MNCKSCNYPLWNIRNRQCPECGAAFVPSDFDFVPNSVCFCCPHCDQSYYGIGERGHLEPRRFECIKCRQTIDMDEMVLRPAAGVDERVTQADRMPWFERDQRGTVKAWFATMGAAMTRPANLIRAVPRDHSVGSAWLFMFISNLIFALIGGGIPLLFTVVIMQLISRQVPGMAAMMPMMFSQTIWQLPMQLVLLAVAPPLWAWLTHLLLMIGDRPAEKLSRTAHCIYYSSAANCIAAIPCGDCAQLGGKIWWLVSAILMVKESHRVSGGKATFAVLVSGIVVWGGTIVAAIVIALMTMGFPGGSFANFGATIGSNFTAQTLWGELSSYTTAHDGYGPHHAAELLIEDAGPAFVPFVIASSEQNVPIGETTLQQFKLLTSAEQKEIVADVVAQQPDGVVAHRLGDVVFTYHGIDFTSADKRLWAFIVAPDPTMSSWSPSLPYTIARVDGTTYQVTPEKFILEYQAQNQFRQNAALPPLPGDILSILHGNPAIAPAPGAGAPADEPADDDANAQNRKSDN